MRQQPKAEYTDPADKSTRLTENEHGTPHAQNAAIDETYDESAYRADATVRSPRGVSLDKTAGDNAASAAIKQRVNNGQPVNVTEDIDMPSNARFQASNEAARAAGKPHIENSGSINRGTLEQMGNRFNQSRRTGRSLPPAPGGMTPGALGVVGRAVPGVVEGEALLFSAAAAAGSHAVTAPLAAPLLGAAEALPVVAGVGVVGAVAGHAARAGAKELGADEATADTIGLGAAVLTGAALGSVIPGVGTAVGAAIGALVAGGLYLWSL
jgi:hypothetical protein